MLGLNLVCVSLSMAIGFSTANAIDNNERIADKSDDKFGKEIQTTVIVVSSFGLKYRLGEDSILMLIAIS